MSEEKEDDDERKTFWQFGDFLVQYFHDVFTSLGVLLVMKTLKDEWYVVIKVYHILCVCAIPTYRVY